MQRKLQARISSPVRWEDVDESVGPLAGRSMAMSNFSTMLCIIGKLHGFEEALQLIAVEEEHFLCVIGGNNRLYI